MIGPEHFNASLAPTHGEAPELRPFPRGVGGPSRRLPGWDRYEHVVFAATGVRASPVTPLTLVPPGARRRPPVRDGELTETEAAFCAWICARGGVELGHYRPEVLRRRIAACLRAVRARGLDEAREAIDRYPANLDRALSALLIGVTSFFRDASVWQELSKLLPRLTRARSGAHSAEPDTPCTACSFACSDGSELYSVAMLLADAGLLNRWQLVGVDCRNEAITEARAGVYPAEAIAGLGPGPARHFEPVAPLRLLRSGAGSPPRLRIGSSLRQVCRWEAADAFAAADRPEPLDLALCRNLAIYLEPDAAARLWRGITRRLRIGGVLVVGKAERPEGVAPTRCGRSVADPGAGGELVRIGPCIYMKREARS